MANIKFFRGKKTAIDAQPKQDGSLYIATDTRKIYLDSGSERLEIAPQSATDLSNYVTEDMLADAVAAEAAEREKQDGLLEDLITTKVSPQDIVAGQDIDVQVNPDSGQITISTELPDVSEFITVTEANAAYAAKTHTHSILQVTDLQTNLNTLQDNIDTKANKTHTHAASDIASGVINIDNIPDIPTDKLTGVIPEDNLPSYVDAIKEYASFNDFPLTGETLHIYVALDTNKTYRWGGSQYVEISPSIALGTTSSTAFRGDYGNTAYQHATAKGAAFNSGLYKITTNAQGHVTAATAVTKADITALGIPGEQTEGGATYTLTKSGSTITLTGSNGDKYDVTDSNTTYGDATTSADGLMTKEMVTKLNGIAAGANAYTHPTATAYPSGFYKITTNNLGHITAATAVTKNDIVGLGIPAENTDTNTTYSISKSGSTITLSGSDGTTTTVTDSNTTYSAATTSDAGLMSAADKAKLDGIATGANAYTLPTASATTLGGIKVGSGLSISNGVLSAAGGGDTTWYTTKTDGQLYKATAAPTGTTRGCYDGYFYATRVYNAVYIDYAEYFPKAEDIQVGHLAYAGIDGVKASGKPKAVVGIVSDQYGHILGGNGDGKDDENFAAIALAGRVPVEIECERVELGDLIAATDHGIGYVNNDAPRNEVIGKVVGVDPQGRDNYVEVLVGSW